MLSGLFLFLSVEIKSNYCFPHLQSANRQIHKLVNSVFSAKEEMFLSNLHGLAGGSLIFTEQTEFTKFRICEFAYLQTVNEENINSNFWAKIIYKSSLNFWNWLVVVITRPNLEIDTTQSSKFSKFGLTSQLHSFPWLKNTPYFDFRIKIDRITCVWFIHLLRSCSLCLGKLFKNCLDFTYYNPKEQLIFGAPS